MAVRLTSIITNQGHQYLSLGQVRGYSMIIDRFSISDGGHNPSNADVAITPSLNITELPGTLLLDRKVIPPEDINVIDSLCPEWTCRVGLSEAIGSNSALGLYGRVLGAFDANGNPNPTDPLIGTSFLYAVAAFAVVTKHAGAEINYVVGIRQ